MSSFYRQQLESYLKTLDVTADLVYDIGGKQKTVEGRTKTWNVKELLTLDVPEYDLNEPYTVDRQADMIFCLEVFEYLIQPATAFENIANALKPGGKAVISFPLIYPVHNEVEFDSLRYTQRGITRLAERAGLKVTKVTYRRTKSKTLVHYYNEDGMRMAKGEDHNVTGYIVEFRK